MQSLIANGLNEKSVVNNILSGKLNNLVLLLGPYGTGKSEFAKTIARMLTCENLSTDGYCGECSSCLAEIGYGINSINSTIHFLNMEKVSYEEMTLLISQCVNKIRSSAEVYIFDEFHLVEKKAQELWLAETSRLEDCYIIMTSTEKKRIEDGIISRSIQLPMKLLTPLEAKSLVKIHYTHVSNMVAEAIIKKIGGCPRELINSSKFYSNSGLAEEEILEHLANVNQSEIVFLLEALRNRELFFERFRSVRTLSSYAVQTVLKDLLWDYIGATEIERKKLTIFTDFEEKQIMRFLDEANKDPFMALLSMFRAVGFREPINKDQTQLISQSVESSKSNGEKIEKKQRW